MLTFSLDNASAKSALSLASAIIRRMTIAMPQTKRLCRTDQIKDALNGKGKVGSRA